MSRTYEECFRQLNKLASVNGASDIELNEDTTRLRLIDTLLFECLDWDRCQATTEQITPAGIVDYVLRPGNTPLLVVEAKKSGINFSIPIGQTSTRLIRTLESVMSLDGDIKKAIEQVARYALDNAIPFAAVCNGHQIIVFCIQSPVGVSWRSTKALVFDSLASIKDHFKDFWDALSTNAIRTFSLRELLAKTTRTTPARRPSSQIINFDRTKNRNQLQATLQVLGDRVFVGAIFKDRTFFHEYCYCKAGAISQASLASRVYLADRYPALFSSTAHTPALEPAQTKKGVASALTNLTNIEKPIIILGDVGAGKTTFLERLLLVDWSDKSKDLVAIRVDLAGTPSKTTDLPDMIANEIELSLRENYNIDITENDFLRAAYHSDLARFRRTPQGELNRNNPVLLRKDETTFLIDARKLLDKHLQTVFRHLQNQKKICVVIIDNVDQRDSGLQQAAFVQAQIASSNWGVLVFIALRPETFVKTKLDGSLSGYHTRAFTISPPRFDELIQKRIEAAKKILIETDNSDDETNDANSYLEILRRSFEGNPELSSFCEDLSAGNMRTSLDYIVAFMSCGHVDVPKILEKSINQNRYQIPLHEFTRGVMFSDREHYSETSGSLIINLYDCYTNDCYESFLLISILDNLSNDEYLDGSNYYVLTDLETKILTSGFRIEQFHWALKRCLDRRLIETNLKTLDPQSPTHVRITPAGNYYFKKLIRSFTYNDAVCLDTPVCDNVYFSKLTEVSQFDQRIIRCRSFIQYLDSLYHKNRDLELICNWSSIASDINQDIASAERNNARASGRRHRTQL